MTSEQRKQALKKIQESSTPCMTGITITYHGERKSFNAYKIPLNILTYNPYNGRIGSEVKSFERQKHILNPDDVSDIKIIEKLLMESKVSANKRTRKSLLEDHQQRYGIVTADGKIIDGNRRACLLNDIFSDETIPVNIKQHSQYFIAIILPIDADRKEILRLETTYQMGEDAKVDYGPIEKYLKASDLAEEGFSNNEIASFMGVKQAEVKNYLNILKTMNDYLDTYGYTGIYTMLEKTEDLFIRLETAIRSYSNGGVSQMWGYDIESDVSDLKNIAFDYIRLGQDQQDFRDIIRKPTRANKYVSLFSNEQIWTKFANEHFNIIEAIEEDDVEDLLRKNPDTDLKRILIARDNKWKRAVSEKLNENYSNSKDILNNKQQATEPLKLLHKALEALSAIDITQTAKTLNNPIVRDCLEKIEEKYTNIKKAFVKERS